MLNGRGQGPSSFTSVSNKGSAAVDYCLVPVDCYSKFSEFKITDALLLADSLGIIVPSKIPDHFLLAWKVSLHSSSPFTSAANKAKSRISLHIPEDYMQSVIALSKIGQLVEQLDSANSQSSINAIYNEICTNH